VSPFTSLRLLVHCIRSSQAAALADEQQEEEDTDPSTQPFVRTYNLWRENAILRAFVCQPSLWRTAARLLGVSKVQLYQDSVFLKEPGNSASPWHQDQAACPLATDCFVTAWIPLSDLTDAHGTLRFASGSHLCDHRTLGHRPSADGQRKLYRPREYRPCTVDEVGIRKAGVVRNFVRTRQRPTGIYIDSLKHMY
jgi:ectoine hydroxylase-related dioxygenase (phytanoyl-CoA dioxygenase family)